MPKIDAFSENYVEARARFREAAAQRGANLTSINYGGQGPDGSPLTIDVAELGEPSTGRLLIISSGLHGVEGFLGSALQLDWLRSHRKLTPGVRVALIHGIDAYGFAWLRRFDEENIDLNRNFLDEGDPYEGSPALYRELDPLLNPPRPPRRFSAFPLYAIYHLMKHGPSAVRQAVAEGQYDFPQGLFFGGHGPARANRLLAELVPQLVRNAAHILHMDVHSGLGPWANLVLLPTLRSGESSVLQTLGGLDEYLGSHFVEDQAYRTRGDVGGWLTHRFAGRDYLYLCAEFGTYSAGRVVAALRAENQARHHGASATIERRVKARIREVFAPASASWRRMTLESGSRVIGLSLESLASLASLSHARLG